MFLLWNASFSNCFFSFSFICLKRIKKHSLHIQSVQQPSDFLNSKRLIRKATFYLYIPFVVRNRLIMPPADIISWFIDALQNLIRFGCEHLDQVHSKSFREMTSHRRYLKHSLKYLCCKLTLRPLGDFSSPRIYNQDSYIPT